MKTIFSFLVFVVVVLALQLSSDCDASPSNPNGAIHARITANGFSYISSVLKNILDEKVKRLSVPNISGNERRVRYEVKNVRIETMSPGPSSIEATPGGLKWKLTINEIRLRADWWFRYKKGWVKLSDSGNARGTIRNLRFDVTLRPRAVDGKLVPSTFVIPNDCASVSSVDVRIGGSFWSWLYNILIKAFRGKIERSIPSAVCKAAGKAVNDWSAEVFPNMQTSDVIDILDAKFLADYGIITPQFQNSVMNVRFKGEVSPQSSTFNSFPFSPSPMPSTGASKHVYLVISDFVFNTLLYSVKETGVIRKTYSTADVDQDIADVLDGLCKGIPGTGGQISCASMEFSFDVLERPAMTFSKSKGVTLELKKAQVQVRRQSDGQMSDLVKIHIDVSLSAQPRLSSDGRRLFFSFSPPQINFDVIEPTIPADEERQAKNFVRMAGARYGQRALNKWGNVKGMEIPNVKGKIDIEDRELLVEDGALVVASNLVVKF